MKPLIREKIGKILWEVAQTIHRERQAISTFRFYDGDLPGAEAPDRDDSAWATFNVGDTWGGYDKTAWFRATVRVPEHLQGKKLALCFRVGPRGGGDSTAEALLYINGRPLQGLDVWHEEAWLPPDLHKVPLQLALKAWSGVLGVPDKRRFEVAELVWVNARRKVFLPRRHPEACASRTGRKRLALRQNFRRTPRGRQPAGL